MRKWKVPFDKICHHFGSSKNAMLRNSSKQYFKQYNLEGGSPKYRFELIHEGDTCITITAASNLQQFVTGQFTKLETWKYYHAAWKYRYHLWF